MLSSNETATGKGQNPIYIDLLKLDQNPVHQKILGKFLKSQSDKAKLSPHKGEKFGKKLNSDQPFTLSHSILMIPGKQGKHLFRVLANVKEEKGPAGKRQNLGKGNFGTAIKAYSLNLKESNNVILAVLDKTSKRVIKKTQNSPKNNPQAEYECLKKLSYCDAQGTLERVNKFYIDMKKIKGKNLRVILDSKSPLTDIERFEIIICLLKNLKGIHKANIVHCDIKPENIIVDLEAKTATIIDFGLARQIGMVFNGGTATYAAPEVFIEELNRCHPARDIYSLHVVLGEIWGGADRFNNKPVEFIAYNHKKMDDVKRFTDFSGMTDLNKKDAQSIQTNIQKALSVKPQDRVSIEDSLQMYQKLYNQALKSKKRPQSISKSKGLGAVFSATLAFEGIAFGLSYIPKLHPYFHTACAFVKGIAPAKLVAGVIGLALGWKIVLAAVAVVAVAALVSAMVIGCINLYEWHKNKSFPKQIEDKKIVSKPLDKRYSCFSLPWFMDKFTPRPAKPTITFQATG